jgi:hypothetical protein
MQILTEDALVFCGHQVGKVTLFPSQQLVTINQRCVLVEPDPVGKPIVGCPIPITPTTKPCMTTLPAFIGYSTLLTIDGRRVCLDAISGLTDGVAPVPYRVMQAGQQFVSATL